MSFYLAAYLWGLFLVFYARKLPMILGPVLVAPLIFFSTFRGTSGPDTETYIRQFNNISDHFSTLSDFVYEPVNSALMYFAWKFWPSSHFAYFAAHSFILSYLFYLLCRRYEEYRIFLLTLGVVFLLDGLTNTLRVSLSYFFFLFAVGGGKKIIFYILAFFSHVTSIIMNLVYTLFSVAETSTKLFFVYLLFGFAVLVVLSVYLDSILIMFAVVVGKFDTYQQVMVPSVFSGVSELFVIFCLLSLASWYNKTSRERFLLNLFLVCVLVCVLYFSISLSLAMLRVLKLFVVALTVAPFFKKARRRIPTIMLMGVGVLYTLNFFRVVFFTNGFLPYGV